MSLASFVYRRSLSARGRSARFWHRCRRLLIRFAGDPACVFPIHGRELVLPMSHALPGYLQEQPHYDRVLGRVSAYVRETSGPLRCIDVGANIGDSIAGAYGDGRDRFLAIEPNEKFRSYLERNWKAAGNVTILDVVCHAVDGTLAGEVVEQHGRASVVESAGDGTLQSKSLDRIVEEHAEFAAVNLLKIDTDGQDLDVIAGAAALLGRNTPALLFECASFGRPGYAPECLKTLRSLRRAGYESFLVYDNFGYLMGRHSLDSLSAFADLLFYELTSAFNYFDLLLMRERDLDAFVERERSHFDGAGLPEAMNAVLDPVRRVAV